MGGVGPATPCYSCEVKMPSVWNRAGARLLGAILSATLVLAAGLVAATPARALDTRVTAEVDPEVEPVVVAGTPVIVGAPAVGSTLSVEPGEWSPGATLSYQWLVDGTPAGATHETFTPTSEHVGKAIAVVVTGTLEGFQAAEAMSDATPPVALGTLSGTTPTISGVPTVGSTLTAVPGTWTDGTVLTYQWFANGAAISGANGSTFKLTTAQAAKGIVVKVTGTLGGYTTSVRTSAWTLKVLVVGTPRIIGAPATGIALTGDSRTWTAGTTFTYQWYADGVRIAGATSSVFTPKVAHAGTRLTLEVTGAKAGYPTVARTSSPSLKVMQASTPVISGDVRVGGVLTASRGAWSPGTSISYQWYAGGAAISGATGYRLSLGTAHRDKPITVTVTGTQVGFGKATTQSKPTLRVATTSKPTIIGVSMVGSTLTAKPNTWTTGTAFSYQWLADGVPISGATRSSLALSSSHRDKKITVSVTGRKSGWATVALTSSATPQIAATSNPTIGGRLIAGTTLTAGTSGWTSGTKFSYQWYVNGSAASGETGSTFRLGKGHIGKTIKVVVVGKKAGYQTISRSSATTGAVSSGKSRPATKDNCPSAYPIKGNQTTRHTTDWIYHVPGGSYYAKTDPEECFATATAAVVWGYRASMK